MYQRCQCSCWFEVYESRRLLCLGKWAAGSELLLEQPGYGHMRFTCFGIFVLRLCGDTITTPMCGYIVEPPVYYKPTVLMFCARSLFWKRLFRGCVCTAKHIPLEGRLTTLASAYPEGLCEEIADI